MRASSSVHRDSQVHHLLNPCPPPLPLQDTNSYSGSNGVGIGGGASNSLQICALSDLVCLGDAGAVVVGALGAEASSTASGLAKDGKEGSVAVAKSHGLFGLGAADAANLCLASNCLGAGGSLVLGNAEAGAVGGSIPSSPSSTSSSSRATSSTAAAAAQAQRNRAVPTTAVVSQGPQDLPFFILDPDAPKVAVPKSQLQSVGSKPRPRRQDSRRNS